MSLFDEIEAEKNRERRADKDCIAALEAEKLLTIEELTRFETALTATRELLQTTEKERDDMREQFVIARTLAKENFNGMQELKADNAALRAKVSELEEQREQWRLSSVCREKQMEIERLAKALEFYADAETLAVPEDWNCAKMGGYPDADQLERRDIGDVAREALALCRPEVPKQ